MQGGGEIGQFILGAVGNDGVNAPFLSGVRWERRRFDADGGGTLQIV
jgi:hypothetical protein